MCSYQAIVSHHHSRITAFIPNGIFCRNGQVLHKLDFFKTGFTIRYSVAYSFKLIFKTFTYVIKSLLVYRENVNDNVDNVYKRQNSKKNQFSHQKFIFYLCKTLKTL